MFGNILQANNSSKYELLSNHFHLLFKRIPVAGRLILDGHFVIVVMWTKSRMIPSSIFTNGQKVG